MVENDALKKEKASAIERLEIANRLSEEYKELVVQMQTKLQQTGSRDEFTLLEKRNALDALHQPIYSENDDDVNDEKEDTLKPLNVNIAKQSDLYTISTDTSDSQRTNRLRRRLSDVRGIFNTAVQLKLASDLKAVFGVLDKDHDGTISMEELKKGLLKMR